MSRFPLLTWFKCVASIATDSTCCAGSTTQLTHRVATKTKSDASTCTRDEINLELPDLPSHQFSKPSTFVTTVEIEHNNNVILAKYDPGELCTTDQLVNDISNVPELGFENEAYQVDEEESQFKSRTLLETENIINCDKVQGMPVTKLPEQEADFALSSTSASVTSSDEDESDVSTTIIDGKRAISLSNFGKFAEKQEKREGHRPMGATFGHPMASAGFRAFKNGMPK